MRRFRVAEDSMQPTLRPGDIVVARRESRPDAGTIVAFPHPHAERWLIKRVTACDGAEAWVESDDPNATMADSRTLGWITTTGMYRAIWRLRGPFSWARL